MLKANVGLSRKLTRDYNSTGYAVNIEGEILATPGDPEAVLGRIKELFSLAQEALAVEIDRDQGEQNIASHDEEPAKPATNGPANPEPSPPSPKRGNGAPAGNKSGDDPVTNKQVQFVFNLAKRHRLSAVQLESEIEQIVGRRSRVYDLTKREAGQVIDALNQGGDGNGRSASQRS